MSLWCVVNVNGGKGTWISLARWGKPLMGYKKQYHEYITIHPEKKKSMRMIECSGFGAMWRTIGDQVKFCAVMYALFGSSSLLPKGNNYGTESAAPSLKSLS